MANYITKSDIEAVFGIDNAAKWSNLDNTQAGTNEDRVDAAIAYAEGVIDDRFRDSRYVVPIVGTSGGVPTVVADWGAKLAGIWLYESRGMSDEDETGNKLSDMKENVYAEMDTYLSGARRLGAKRSENGPDAPVVVK